MTVFSHFYTFGMPYVRIYTPPLFRLEESTLFLKVPLILLIFHSVFFSTHQIEAIYLSYNYNAPIYFLSYSAMYKFTCLRK